MATAWGRPGDKAPGSTPGIEPLGSPWRWLCRAGYRVAGPGGGRMGELGGELRARRRARHQRDPTAAMPAPALGVKPPPTAIATEPTREGTHDVGDRRRLAPRQRAPTRAFDGLGDLLDRDHAEERYSARRWFRNLAVAPLVGGDLSDRDHAGDIATKKNARECGRSESRKVRTRRVIPTSCDVPRRISWPRRVAAAHRRRQGFRSLQER
jgi:hypothetical protein